MKTMVSSSPTDALRGGCDWIAKHLTRAAHYTLYDVDLGDPDGFSMNMATGTACRPRFSAPTTATRRGDKFLDHRIILRTRFNNTIRITR